MLKRFAAVVLAVVPMIWAAPVAAQAKQTADGAQAFLAGAAANPGVSKWVISTGLTRLVNGTAATLIIGVTSFDTTDAAGKANPCITRITQMDYTQNLLEANGAFYNTEASPLPPLPGVFATPMYMDWSKTTVTRAIATNPTSTWHTITASFEVPTNNWRMGFRLSTQDAAMADRIEYAMKFLQASCDATANTGF